MKTLKRVVITGIGAITPIGLQLHEIVENLRHARSGIKPIGQIDTSSLPVKFAGEIANFDAGEFIDAKAIRRNDRFIQFALAACQLAVEDSKLLSSQLRHAGVAVGVGLGGLRTIEETAFHYADFRKTGPFFVPSILSNLASGQISIKYGITGPNYAISSACASGSQAIGQAFREIQAGRRTIWLAGGAEAPISTLSIAGFAAARTLSRRNEQYEKASRPFDRDRDGFVLGEGAAILVLESLDSAIDRGAKIYAEIVGFGAASDGYHVTEPQPDGDGAFAAMDEALRDAELDPAELDYINAHATSTPVGDRIEAVALARVLKQNSASTLVSSTKSLTGHLCGAAGAVEAAFCALMLKHKFLPPALNLDEPCSEFEFKSPQTKEASFSPKIVMNNSFGFGGINTSMIFDGQPNL